MAELLKNKLNAQSLMELAAHSSSRAGILPEAFGAGR